MTGKIAFFLRSYAPTIISTLFFALAINIVSTMALETNKNAYPLHTELGLFLAALIFLFAGIAIFSANHKVQTLLEKAITESVNWEAKVEANKTDFLPQFCVFVYLSLLGMFLLASLSIMK